MQGGDDEKGKAIYAKFCESCHGPTGKGDGPAAATLTPKPANFADAKLMGSVPDDSLFKIIREGGAAVGKSPMMPPWGGGLKDEDIRNVIAYLRTFSKR
ncbi:MAG: cytochrome c [candidate division NC10 bacterium]|nr:cytochrome c [candidate division NC10 bacterium]